MTDYNPITAVPRPSSISDKWDDLYYQGFAENQILSVPPSHFIASAHKRANRFYMKRFQERSSSQDIPLLEESLIVSGCSSVEDLCMHPDMLQAALGLNTNDQNCECCPGSSFSCEIQSDDWLFPRPTDTVSQTVISSAVSTANSWMNWVLPDSASMDKSLIGNYLKIEPDTDIIVKLVEDVLILLHMLINADSRLDRYMAILTFSKLRGSAPDTITLLSTFAYELFGLYSAKQAPKIEIQGFETSLKDARKYLDNYEALKGSPLAKKLYKFGLYALSLGFFSKIGVTFDACNYNKIEAEAISRSHTVGFGLAHSLIDTVVFLAERGVQCMKTGNLDPFLHSGSRYQEWFEKATLVQRQAKVLSNPEPHGVTMCQFLADLRDCLEKGEVIKRQVSGVSDFERKTISSILADLHLLQINVLNRRLSQRERKAPFSLLIAGGSSVGKSALTKVLFYHYGKVFDLPTDPEFKYTRQGTEKHWTNFGSYQWCIQLDDIAFLKPGMIPDPTLLEMLSIINNVPYSPEQAALEDKGKTPINADLVLSTTNTPHLNLQAYFSCPFAIARRFPFVVNVSCKYELQTDGKLDPEKVARLAPSVPGAYPDFWNFSITKPMPGGEATNATPTTEHVVDFDNICSFLEWYTKEALLHAKYQKSAMAADTDMSQVVLCKKCFRTSQTCSCMFEPCSRCGEQMGLGEECVLCYATAAMYPQRLSPLPRPVSLSFEIQSDVVVDSYHTRLRDSYAYVRSLGRAGLIGQEMKHWAVDYMCASCANDIEHDCIYHGLHVHGDSGIYDSAKADSDAIARRTLLFRFKVWCFTMLLHNWWLGFVRFYLEYAHGHFWRYKVGIRYFSQYETLKLLFDCMGHRVAAHINVPTIALTIIASVAAIGGVLKLSQKLTSFFSEGEVEEPMNYQQQQEKTYAAMRTAYEAGSSLPVRTKLSEVAQKVAWTKDYELGKDVSVLLADGSTFVLTQGATSSIGGSPEPKETLKKPYYHHDPYVITNLDVSAVSQTVSDEQILIRKVEENSVTFITSIEPHPEGIRENMKVNCATCLTGNIYLVNLHGIVSSDHFYLTVMSSPQVESICSNLRNILVTPSMYIKVPEKDVMFIELPHLRPGKDLIRYFAGKDLRGTFTGVQIGRDRGGSSWQKSITNITWRDTILDGIKLRLPVWWGYASQPTVKGDCGSLLISTGSLKSVILGFHVFGGPREGKFQTGSIQITREFLDKHIPMFRSSMIQSSTIELGAPGIERTLTNVDRKSPVRYLAEGSAIVYGSYTGYRIAHTSKVEKTFICDKVAEKGYVPKFGKPLMNWEPWHAALKDLVRPVTLMNMDILRTVTADFISDIHEGLTDEKLKEVMVYNDVVTMNGKAGVLYCDKMNRNTSAGAPYKCSKRKFLRPVPGEKGEDLVEFTNEIMTMVDGMFEHYQKGEMAHPIYCGNAKDEPKKVGKMTRIFMGSSAAAGFMCRKYNLSGIKLIQENRFLFESGPGTVAQCAEWEEIREYLSRFPLHRIIAGDYGKFDKRMSPAIILEAFSILASIYQRAGYTAEDMKCVWGIAFDTSYPLVDYNGDLIQFFGSNPSGHPLTVIINGLVNSLYMRYCYAVLSGTGSAKDFKKHVALMTYGDDNIMSVSEECTFFNHTAVRDVLASIDVEYTMAEKTAKSVPFINLDQASFLKRVWRWDSDVGAYCAPLEHESIEKMLTARLANDALCAQAHSIAVISTAVREYFHYGKKVFEQRSSLLKGVVSECGIEEYVQPSTFPSWDSLYGLFWQNSKHVTLQRWSDPSQLGMPLYLAKILEGPTSPQSQQVQKTQITEWNETLQSSSVRLDDPKTCFFEIQADIITTNVATDSNTTQETVGFVDEVEGDIMGSNSSSDMISYLDQSANSDLSNFLSRPVRIANFTWLESDPVDTVRSFKPWSLFFNDTRIKYKTNNFSFMQCNLRIKVLVNASPFYYGAMIGSYIPNPAFTPSTIKSGLSPLMRFIPISQRPHMWIIPAENKADMLELPFLYHKNWLNIQEFDDLDNMGTLDFINFTPLASANGAVGSGVTVQVYAWAENVKLSGASVGLAMQSDEYGKGVVSAPASAIAAGARWFEDIPVIGRFATATRIGASAVSSVASLFGWTNVPVIADAQPYRPTSFPQLASSSVGFPVEKLTLDPKNELSVDPGVLGCKQEDELAITNIVQKESFLCQTTWDTTQGSDFILFSSDVTPSMFNFSSELVGNALSFTPMGWAAQLFEGWRGDVIFRFKFIASPFHKGRVRISYDPTGTSANNLYNDPVSQTVVATQIVDLGVDSDIEMRIPYQQLLSFQKINKNYGLVPFSISNAPAFFPDPSFRNGVITLRVHTALSAPVAVSAIQVLIFVRGAENLEFVNPVEAPYVSTFPVQSDVYGQPTTFFAGANTSAPSKDRYLVNYGECIRSLRTLLRRQSLYLVQQPPQGLSAVHVLSYFNASKYPVMYGYDPLGIHTAASLTGGPTAPFNFVKPTPLAYLMPAFVGTRGSVQWTVNTQSVNPNMQTRVYRRVLPVSTTGISYDNLVLRSTSSIAARFYNVFAGGGASGQAIINQQTTSGLCFQAPNYTRYRMMSTSPAKYSAPSTIDDGNLDTFRIETSSDSTDDTTSISSFKWWMYNGIGTDFNLYFFLNVPTYYTYNFIPTGV